MSGRYTVVLHILCDLLGVRRLKYITRQPTAHLLTYKTNKL